MTEPIVLDNTKRATFCNCKKKYFFAHEKGLQSNYGSTAIRYGVCRHGMWEGYYSFVKEHGWPKGDPAKAMNALMAGLSLGKSKYDKESQTKQFIDDYKNFNTASEAMPAYISYYASDSDYLKVLATETLFSCPIEPESEVEDKLLSKLPPIVFTGRIDLLVELQGIVWVLDFKTTGWRLDEVIMKANRSPQLIGYTYAGKNVLDIEANGCLCSFEQINAYKSKKTGEYGDVKFDFRRVPQIYSEGDIQAWKLSFIDTCREILVCKESGIWPESFDNCYQYGACPYLKLCRQHTSFEKLNLNGFHEEFWNVLAEDEA